MRSTPWTVSKQQLVSKHGLVVCQNRKAAQAGAVILEAGGNAVDAAVAAAATLSVVEPWLSGLGGGGFMVSMDGRTGQSQALDFNMCAPAKLDRTRYSLLEGDDSDWFRWPKVKDDRNIHGYESIAVPGAVAGLGAALSALGSMPWSTVLEPALAEAQAGLEVDWYTALALAMDADTLALYPSSADLYLPSGRPPRAVEGARLPLPSMVQTFEQLRRAGPQDLYTGELASLLVRDLQQGGCVLSMEDLATYTPQWTTPLRSSYRGWDVHAMPGLSAGPSLTRALTALETRLAANNLPHRPGPDEALLYSRIIREEYDLRLRTMGHAATSPHLPDPSCTSHISVIDRHGSIACLTNTLLSRFGSRVVTPSLGLLMNNGLMWFDPRPLQPNTLAPGVRPLANMCPVILSRDNKPRYGFGAAGGRTIFPTLLQILSYVLDFGMTLEEAFLFPRVDASTSTIKINALAGEAVARRVAEVFPVSVVEDTVYPTRFSQPSAVSRDVTTGLNTAMAYHNSPCAAVVEGAGIGGDAS